MQAFVFAQSCFSCDNAFHYKPCWSTGDVQYKDWSRIVFYLQTCMHE